MGRSLQLLNPLGGKSSNLLIPKCKFQLSSSPLFLLTAQSLLSRERLKQMLAVLVTTVVLIAKTRRITSATRHPNNNIKFITTLTLLVMTPRLLANTTQVTMGMVDTTSVLLILVMNITVKTRRKCSARNTPRKILVRSPSKNVRKL